MTSNGTALQRRASTTVICGVPIDDVTLAETVDRVCELVARGRATGRTHQVATVNVDFVVNALADRSLLSLLQHVDIAVPDGMPIVWGSRLLGTPLRERVAGADLVPALAKRCAAEGYSIYLFGAGEGVAHRAAALLRARHPALRVVGDAGPFFVAPEEMDGVVLDRIREARPDVLCVALGHPKQERWIDAYRHALGVPVLMGVGGTLDFLAGTTRRAPGWMQRGGVEWIHRAFGEPRRLGRRYARDAVRFGPELLRDVATARGVRSAPSRGGVAWRRDDVTVLFPRGRLELSATALGWTAQAWLAPPTGHHVVIDLADVPTLCHADVADVVGLAKRLRDRGGRLTLSSVPAAVAQVILDLRLYEFLSTASSALYERAALTDDVTWTWVPGTPPSPQRPSVPAPGGRRMTRV